MDNSLYKLPPNSIEAEESLISGILINNDTLSDIIDILIPEDFYRTAHQKIFSGIIKLHVKKEPIDLVTLPNILKEAGMLEEIGGATYLVTLIDTVPLAVNPEHYAKIIKKASVARQLIEAADEIAKSAYDSNGNIVDILDAAQVRIININFDMDSNNFVSISDLIPKRIDQYEEMSNQKRVLGIQTGFADIDRLTGGLKGSKFVVIAARPRVGKCLGKGTKIVMYSGALKKVEDVKVGDLLMGVDSKPRKVLSTITGTEMMYWISQKKGIDYRVNGSHLLSLKRSKNEGNKKHGEIKNISVNDILSNHAKSFLDRWKGYKVGIRFLEKSVPIEPYFLGLWLGDGKSSDSRIYNTDNEVTEYLEQYAKRRDEAVSVGDENRNCYSYTITNGLKRGCGVRGEKNCMAKLTNKDVSKIKNLLKKGMMQKDIAQLYKINPTMISNINTGRTWRGKKHKLSIQSELRKMSLLNNKHIPEAYLINSRKIRMELLAGLIDSDGHLCETGCYEITMNSLPLMQQIKYLCDSLGLCTGKGVKEKTATNQNGFSGIVYRLHISGKLNDYPVKIKRKKQKISFYYDRTMTGIHIEQDKPDSYYGFTLDKDGLFLLEDMTVTHNTAIMMNMATNMAKAGRKIGIFSIEMDKEELVDRLISSKSGVNTIKLASGWGLNSEEWEKITYAAERIYEYPIIIDDTGGLKIQELKRRARKMVKDGIEIIFIDQLSKIRGGKGRSEYEQRSYIVNEIAILKKELRIPICLLAQINRKLEDRTNKKPTLGDLKSTGSLEEDADLVLLGHRKYEYTKAKEDKHHAEWEIAKHRQGATCNIKMYWNGKTVTFSSLQRE